MYSFLDETKYKSSTNSGNVCSCLFLRAFSSVFYGSPEGTLIFRLVKSDEATKILASSNKKNDEATKMPHFVKYLFSRSRIFFQHAIQKRYEKI